MRASEISIEVDVFVCSQRVPSLGNKETKGASQGIL